MRRPALTFGHFVWAWKATTSTIKRKLERLQAMALRMCGHFCRSTPKVGMEMILNILLIDLFLEFEIGRSYHWLRGTLKNPLYVSYGFGHIEVAKRAIKEAQLEDVEPDICKRYTCAVNPRVHEGRKPP